MHRRLLFVMTVMLVFGCIATPDASAQQSVNFFIGGFTPRAIDARPREDVLVQNGTFLSIANRTSGIDIGQFNSVTVGGEWLFGMTRNVEGGLGLGFYQRSVPTVYADLVNANGTEIEQALKLRIVPFTATIRLLPFGTDRSIQPYIGTGVGVYQELLLLDAAHIIANRDEKLGQPVVPNGIPLSKIHHAAFDAHLIGIDPDYKLHVADRLLAQNDGPMLEALKRLNGGMIRLPSRARDRPDRDRLAQRYERFKAVA